MHSLLVGLFVVLAGQVSDPRYSGIDAETASETGATPADETAAVGETPTQITVAPETPPPTLVDGAPPASDAAAAAAFDSNPFRTEQPPAGAADGAPAGTESPAAAVPPETSVLAASGPKPAEVMQSLLIVPAGAQLPGIAITLGDAVRGAADRSSQTQLAKAYWQLSAAAAQYYLAVHEQADLNTLRQGVTNPAAAWTAAVDDASRRVAISREAAAAAQLRLHRMMGASANVSLPLPADPPHAGRYNTRYDEIFTTRQDPAARQLNDLLPMHYKALVDQARLIAEAGEWLLFVSENRDTANDGLGLLRAYDLVALRRRAFVDAVAEYNQDIAEYAELAAPDEVRPERLVSMLIRVSNTTGGDSAGNVQTASAEEPVVADASATGRTAAAPETRDGRPRTFANWRPFERLRNRERSIVSSRHLLRRGARDRD
jgi:hypothetical protein